MSVKRGQSVQRPKRANTKQMHFMALKESKNVLVLWFFLILRSWRILSLKTLVEYPALRSTPPPQYVIGL